VLLIWARRERACACASGMALVGVACGGGAERATWEELPALITPTVLMLLSGVRWERVCARRLMLPGVRWWGWRECGGGGGDGGGGGRKWTGVERGVVVMEVVCVGGGGVLGQERGRLLWEGGGGGVEGGKVERGAVVCAGGGGALGQAGRGLCLITGAASLLLPQQMPRLLLA